MRKLDWHRRLADLATKSHEYFGLAVALDEPTRIRLALEINLLQPSIAIGNRRIHRDHLAPTWSLDHPGVGAVTAACGAVVRADDDPSFGHR